eukprot:gene14900-biopygen11177
MGARRRQRASALVKGSLGSTRCPQKRVSLVRRLACPSSHCCAKHCAKHFDGNMSQMLVLCIRSRGIEYQGCGQNEHGRLEAQARKHASQRTMDARRRQRASTLVKGSLGSTRCPQKHVSLVRRLACPSSHCCAERASDELSPLYTHGNPLWEPRADLSTPHGHPRLWCTFRAFVGVVGSPEGGHDPCWAPRLAALKARRRKIHPCPRLLETRVLVPSEVKCTQGLGSVLSSVRDQSHIVNPSGGDGIGIEFGWVAKHTWCPIVSGEHFQEKTIKSGVGDGRKTCFEGMRHRKYGESSKMQEIMPDTVQGWHAEDVIFEAFWSILQAFWPPKLAKSGLKDVPKRRGCTRPLPMGPIDGRKMQFWMIMPDVVQQWHAENVLFEAFWSISPAFCPQN